MEPIKITFLGTSGAIPTKKRSHTAILLTYKNENILVDCGESTQRQFKLAGISPHKLTKILITHHHGDHILGIPGLLQTLAMGNYSKTLEIYGPKGTKKTLELIGKATNQLKIKTKIKETKKQVTKTEEFVIQSAEMKHGVPSFAYSFQTTPKIRLNKTKIKKYNLPNSPLLKKLQQGKTIKYKGKTIKPKDVCYSEPSRKITFVLDTAPNPNIVKLAKDSNLLIIESTFTEKEKAKAIQGKHLTAKQAATFAKKAGVKKLILTHLSERYQKNPKPVLQEAKKIFKNTTLADDFDKITI